MRKEDIRRKTNMKNVNKSLTKRERERERERERRIRTKETSYKLIRSEERKLK